MTGEKVKEVIALYRRELERRGVPKCSLPHDMQPDHFVDILSHCHGMLDEMEAFVDEGRLEKAFRWLGFVQGCLVCCHVYTIGELKEHNRPAPESEPPEVQLRMDLA